MTEYLKCRANAKINLTLECTGRRDDGYHLLDMCMTSVTLYDELTFRKSGNGFSISVNGGDNIPNDEQNLIFKAAKILCDHAGISLPETEITLLKRIPSQAGLGGGSADAAATLTALNEMEGLGYSSAELAAIGEKVGADVPFCVTGGTARVRGIGELIDTLPPMPSADILILMPERGNSTPEMFRLMDSAQESTGGYSEKAAELIKAGDLYGIAENLRNDFSGFSYRYEEMKKIFEENGALGAGLSGSGAAAFGIFNDSERMNRCADAAWAEGFSAYAVRPAGAGTEIIERKEK